MDPNSQMTVEQLEQAKKETESLLQKIDRLLIEKGAYPLEVISHTSTDELNDPDDIDMRDWASDGVPKSYFSALYDDDDPVEMFGEKLGKLGFNWRARNSFEFNRMPISNEEAAEAIAKYAEENF